MTRKSNLDNEEGNCAPRAPRNYREDMANDASFKYKSISERQSLANEREFYQDIIRGPWYGNALDSRVNWLVADRRDALIHDHNSGMSYDRLAQKYVRDDYEISPSLAVAMVQGALERLSSGKEIVIKTPAESQKGLFDIAAIDEMPIQPTIPSVIVPGLDTNSYGLEEVL